MKQEDIPQDHSTLSQKNMRELCYAVGKNGKYSTGLSTGWEPKSIALDLTLEAINKQAEIAKQEVYDGKKSPLYYFMIVSKMDLGILAGYMGKSKWRIKRQQKPSVFKKLNDSKLQAYADVFDIAIEKIKHFNE